MKDLVVITGGTRGLGLEPKKVAKVVYDNVTNDDLSVAEIVIERV